MDKDDVLKTVAGHVPELNAGVFKVDIGEGVTVGPLTQFDIRPAVLGIVVIEFETAGRSGGRRSRHLRRGP